LPLADTHSGCWWWRRFHQIFRSWRLMFLTFYGKPRGDKAYLNMHESPNVMLAAGDPGDWCGLPACFY
jgi:NADH:ubiquinone oxidoreductase subunit 5 (subunit L)/multisubunit Na+/H+ antiporter MnhA subunit